MEAAGVFPRNFIKFFFSAASNISLGVSARLEFFNIEIAANLKFCFPLGNVSSFILQIY
jgi:hypothetical protein